MSILGSIYVAHARWVVPLVAAWNAPPEEAAPMPTSDDTPLYCIAWADGTFSVPLPFMVCAIGVLQVTKPALDIMPAECVACQRQAGMVCCVAAEVAW